MYYYVLVVIYVVKLVAIYSCLMISTCIVGAVEGSTGNGSTCSIFECTFSIFECTCSIFESHVRLNFLFIDKSRASC